MENKITKLKQCVKRLFSKKYVNLGAVYELKKRGIGVY